MDTLQHQIALTLLPQIGPITAKMLVNACGSAEAVFRARKKELFNIPGIGATVVASLQSPDALRLAEKELRFLEDHQVSALFFQDKKYPYRLLQCADAPVLLYFKGSDIKLRNADRILGVVGTRQPTEHGKAICEEIIEALQALDIRIVSGLAFGIDVTAHRKACQMDMPNIGVLGHGLGSIYPQQHRSVALKMIENGGLLSEYTHEAKPDREHFPMRNRIIAGLCDALLVVETAASGGSMITATLAARYDRDIMAVPGRPHDAKSAGCNYLIRSQLARLVENAEDIALAMHWEEPGKNKPVQAQLLFDVDPNAQQLIDLIRQKPEIQIDELAALSRFSTGELASLILGLEFKGAIKTLPGKRYVALGF